MHSLILAALCVIGLIALAALGALVVFLYECWADARERNKERNLGRTP